MYSNVWTAIHLCIVSIKYGFGMYSVTWCVQTNLQSPHQNVVQQVCKESMIKRKIFPAVTKLCSYHTTTDHIFRMFIINIVSVKEVR